MSKRNQEALKLPRRSKYTKVKSEANIYHNNMYKSYRVKMTRKGTTFDKSFKTLEMAINFRDLVYADKVPPEEGRKSMSNGKRAVSANIPFEFSKRLFFEFDRVDGVIAIKIQIGKLSKQINMPKAKAKELRAWLTSATQMK